MHTYSASTPCQSCGGVSTSELPLWVRAETLLCEGCEKVPIRSARIAAIDALIAPDPVLIRAAIAEVDAKRQEIDRQEAAEGVPHRKALQDIRDRLRGTRAELFALRRALERKL